MGQIKKEDPNYYFVLVKFNLYNDRGNITRRSEYTQYYPCSNSKIAYCYLSNQNKNIIICLYVSKYSSFTLIFFDTYLQYKNKAILPINNQANFYKFFHFEENLYFLSYMKNENGNNYNEIQILEIITTESSYEVNLHNRILLDIYAVNNGFLLTDILLIREKVVCLASTNVDK
jgi:hypothetical protein